MDILFGLVLIVVILAAAVWLFVVKVGNARFEVRLESRTPFALMELTKDSATFYTKIEFANTGKQCGTIMDCYVRHLLPYEQFDGVRVVSKAELAGAPREDDYFEATLIQRGESIYILAMVTLTARKHEDIKAALAEMVDMPIDLVYQYVARDPWRITKQRMVLTAAEARALVDGAKPES